MSQSRNSKFPKISVITPSYNQGKYLEETMLSVLNQGYPNLEYIVVDGGSSDESKKIIKKYQKNLHYWVSEPDNGQSEAINKGFSKSSGEILTWINSDDVLRSGSLWLVASIFQQTEVEWLTSLPSTINHQGFQQYMAQPPFYIRKLIRNGWYTRKKLGFIMQEGTFWSRDLWQKSGAKVSPVPYSMDFKLWQKFAEFSDLTVVHTTLATYRLNPDRKNNDQHQKYYQEIGSTIPEWVFFPVRVGWRQLAKVANSCNLSPKVYFSEAQNTWIYQQPWKSAKTITLLGST